MSATTTGFDHPVFDALTAIEAGLSALGEAPLWSLPAAQLAQLLVRAEGSARRMEAVLVGLTNQADVMGVAEREGATSLPAWLRATADVAISDTKHRLRLHQALTSRDVTAAAFRAGRISRAGAAAVCDALAAMPAATPAALTGDVEQLLVEVAAEEGTAAVVRRATEIAHRFAPDELAARETRQADANRLTLRLHPDGSLGLRAHLDAEAAATVLPVLGAYATPRPGADHTPDPRGADTRHAEALIDICRAASTEAPTSRGEPPHLAITISLDALQNKLHTAPGLLNTGAPISAPTARRLACDAHLVPVVLGANSEPLDVGRATRLWPTPIRRAIETRDHGCTMPGCDRPAPWCDTHHLIHWADGGPTSVDNGTLLCRKHHTLLHHHGWTATMIDNRPHHIPPRWLDPTRTPRLHSRFKTRTLTSGP